MAGENNEGSLPAAPPETPGWPSNPLPINFAGFESLNTKPPRPGIEDPEMAWCDGFMPIGKSNLRTLYGVGLPIFGVPAPTHIPTTLVFDRPLALGLCADQAGFGLDSNFPFDTFFVQVFDQDGNPMTTFVGPITVALASNPGGAVLSGTVTQIADGFEASFGNFSSPVVSDLGISKTVGMGYTLIASAGALTAISSSFDVTVGPFAVCFS